jgi:hypothetical protein
MRLAFCLVLAASAGLGIVGCSDDDYRSTASTDDGGTVDGGDLSATPTDLAKAPDLATLPTGDLAI